MKARGHRWFWGSYPSSSGAPVLSLVDEIMAREPVAFWRHLGNLPTDVLRIGAIDVSGNGNDLYSWNGGGDADGYPQDAASLVPSDTDDPAIAFVHNSNCWSEVTRADLALANSISMWMRLTIGDLTGGDHYDVARKGEYGAYITAAGLFEFFITRGGIFSTLATDAVVEAETHDYGCSYDHTTGDIAIAIDGVEVETLNVGPGAVEASTSNFVFGQYATATDSLIGTLDEVCVFDSALAESDFLAFHDAAVAS